MKLISLPIFKHLSFAQRDFTRSWRALKTCCDPVFPGLLRRRLLAMTLKGDASSFTQDQRAPLLSSLRALKARGNLVFFTGALRHLRFLAMTLKGDASSFTQDQRAPLLSSLRALKARGNLVYFTGALRHLRFMAMIFVNTIQLNKFLRKKRRSVLVTLLSLSLLLLLSGCMGMNEAFECPPGKGVGCVSTMRINEMVNQGELREEEFTETPPSKPSQNKGAICTDC